jgi:hypothetical protein
MDSKEIVEIARNLTSNPVIVDLLKDIKSRRPRSDRSIIVVNSAGMRIDNLKSFLLIPNLGSK